MPKDQVVPKKVKFDVDFLGCVECSTNGDSLGERRIFVLPSCSADTKAGGEPFLVLNQSLFYPCNLKFFG
jgi:hypothetical protein